MRKRGKKGQILGIPFGMLFSIVLIIAFIAVAIYAILMFLDIKKCSSTGLFKQDLQAEITKAWNSEESSKDIELNLPTSIKKVCFINQNKEQIGQYKEQYDKLKKIGLVNLNMFFYPLEKACEKQKAYEISHLDIEKITEQENPYCADNIKGKVELRIEKGFNDLLVNLS